MPNTSGLVSRKDVVATQDAVVVERYRQAGFIVLAVTNISELCMWYESSNKVRLQASASTSLPAPGVFHATLIENCV